MSWKLRPRARNNDYGSSEDGTVIFCFVILPLLLIGLYKATVPTLIISSLIMFFGILKKVNEPKSSLNNEDQTRYGIKGGRYEMRYSKKTGKPYRHYF
mgnify:CR=1 FL=1